MTDLAEVPRNIGPKLREIKELMAGEEDFLRPLIGLVVREVLEAEMNEALGAQKGERTEERMGYRSGYYVRNLVTRVGKLELGVPQDRQGRFSTQLFDGRPHSVSADARLTLLDALSEDLGLTGTKKGCDHGQCGACTVLVDNRRVLSCLTLAATVNGAKVRTIDGLSTGDKLHPMQDAFIKHDALQCGYCASAAPELTYRPLKKLTYLFGLPLAKLGEVAR